MQNPSLLAELFEKYINNHCSAVETDMLLQLLKDEKNRQMAEALIGNRLMDDSGLRPIDAALDDRLSRRLQNVLMQDDSGSQRAAGKLVPIDRKFSIRRASGWVAACMILLLGAGYLWRSAWQARSIRVHTAVSDPARTGDMIRKESYTQNISLPDGSMVILKAGSTLEYPGVFKGTMREVSLSGEAYFDIAPIRERPFVIRTGKLRTTVLGTAFNIRAYPGQKDVVVSVTSGKVRVEAPAGVIAELGRNQQVIYDLATNESRQNSVDGATVVKDWTKQDMTFENFTFGAIARILEKRFGVTIQFVHPALEQCTITASFDGTEPLENVLTVLCRVRPARYHIDEKKVIIDGEGCK